MLNQQTQLATGLDEFDWLTSTSSGDLTAASFNNHQERA
jgi:hypothetical protein